MKDFQGDYAALAAVDCAMAAYSTLMNARDKLLESAHYWQRLVNFELLFQRRVWLLSFCINLEENSYGG